ncbi:MAG: NAD+ synthase [Bacteroidales bacterium]|nr:NAD+ synthase [Bacteroidales bacterium]
MKIALAQLNFHIGNFESNKSKIIQAIEKAKTMGADLVVFAELAISGYPPRDFLEFDDFINKCQRSIEDIASHCNDIAIIIGGPSKNPEKKGKGLFNTAFFIADGKIQSKHHKSLLPNYDIFDEYRYFEPNTIFKTIDYKGRRLAITICEDLWNIGDDLLYRNNPMDELMKSQPDIIINIAASPFHYNQASNRKSVLKQNVEKYGLPLVYVNHVGAQTELLFDGGSLALDKNAEIIYELPYFTEDLYIIDINKTSKKIAVENPPPSKIALIHDALVMGIKNYFQKLGFRKAILGLSGGIDSAVTLVLAARALGAENVKAILLPSQYSSGHSIEDAKKLAENLRVSYDIIPIEDAFKSFESSLEPWFAGTPFNIAEENIQARVRGVILMALSNKFGYILLNTSNKSEAAVGYGTLYGDMNGGLSVLGDVYKTEVFDLARFINSMEEVIPENSITKPPSAELRPGQKDSDSLPDYTILDEILFQYIEKRKGPDEIISMGFDPEVVKKTLSLVNTNEYKRHQTPPILRVSQKAFGMGRRLPIVAKYLALD